MFIFSNSYQLKDINPEIFELCFDSKAPISHFVSLNDYHVFSVKNELFSLKDGKQKKIAGFIADITSLTQHRQLICVGTLSGEVHIFSEHRTAIRQHKSHSAEINDIAITSNKTIVSAGKDNSIHFYDLIEDKHLHKIALGDEQPKKILETSYGLLVFTKGISLYSLENYSLLRNLEVGDVINLSALFSDDAVVFTSRNRLSILDLKEYKIKTSELVHARNIVAVQVHDGKIYSCSVDGHLKSQNIQLKTISDFNLRSNIVSFLIVDDTPFIAMEDGKIMTLQAKPVTKEAAVRPIRKPAYEDDVDYTMIQQSKKKCTEIDRILGNYLYKDAFKKSVDSNDIGQIFYVLKYISEKRSLMKLLKDAEFEFLKDVLVVCLQTVKIDEFTPIIVEMMIIITSIYMNEIVASTELKELICQISREIDEIVIFEETFLKAISFSESFANL